MAQRRKITIRESLNHLDIHDPKIFEDCESREEEFKVIKKLYFKRVLVSHPDKGGDAEIFRNIQTSFELLRDLHNGGKKRKRGADWSFADCFVGRTAASRTTTKKKASATTDYASSSDDDEHGDDEYQEEEDDDDDDDDDNSKEEEEEFDMGSYDEYFSNMQTPSWDYYAEAAEEAVPLYRVELAKSNRSKCTQKGKKAKRCASTNPEEGEQVVEEGKENNNNNEEQTSKEKGQTASSTDTTEMVIATSIGDDGDPPELIQKGEIRVGWINEQSGSYGGWVHLRCWRVPYKIWLGLPDPKECNDPKQFESALNGMNELIFCGFVELSSEQKHKIVRYVMNKDNWAARRKKKTDDSDDKNTTKTDVVVVDTTTTTTTTTPTAAMTDAPKGQDMKKKNEKDAPSMDAVATTSSALVPSRKKQSFVIPIPGKNGASPSNALQGKTFVLTGVFPEVGGGAGLNLGKDKVKQMIQSFGGRVTSAISGKTNVLVVGKDPGFSKVSKARSSDKIVLVAVKDVKEGLDMGCKDWDTFPIITSADESEPMLIENFSQGYQYASGQRNSLALQASQTELAIAQGVLSPKNNKKRKGEVIVIDDDDDGDKDEKNTSTMTTTKAPPKKRAKKLLSKKKKKTKTKSKTNNNNNKAKVVPVKKESMAVEENKTEESTKENINTSQNTATAANVLEEVKTKKVKQEEEDEKVATTTSGSNNIIAAVSTAIVAATARVTRRSSRQQQKAAANAKKETSLSL